MNQSKNIEEKRLPMNVMEQALFLSLCLNEKQFEKYDVNVKSPKRTVKNCYPKKRLLHKKTHKKTKVCRAKRSSHRSRTQQHGERDWDLQKTSEQDATQTMIRDIEDEEDYMRQQFEDEEEMETFRRLLYRGWEEEKKINEIKRKKHQPK